MKLFIKLGNANLIVSTEFASAAMQICENAILVDQKDYWSPDKGLVVCDNQQKTYSFVSDDVLAPPVEAMEKLLEENKAAQTRWLGALSERDNYKQQLNELEKKFQALRESISE